MSGDNEKKKVFISYAREDIKTARKLCDDLREAGADTWLDDDELIPGQDWKAEITKAIKKSGHFIALISTNSVEKRGFVQSELKKALEVLSELPGKDIFIIPARIDNCGIPDELEHFHCADLFPDYEKGFNKILKGIEDDKQDEAESRWNDKQIKLETLTKPEEEKPKSELKIKPGKTGRKTVILLFLLVCVIAYSVSVFFFEKEPVHAQK